MRAGTEVHAGLAAAILLMLGTACDSTPEPATDSAMGRAEGSIVGGGLPTGVNDDAVVALVSDTGVWCSGVLITPSVVLSVASCFADPDVAPQLRVFFGSDLAGGGEFRQIAQVVRNPGFNPMGLERDLALVALATPAPVSVTPIPPLPTVDGIRTDEIDVQVRVLGFGDQVAGGTAHGTKRQAIVTVGELCTTGATNLCEFLGDPVPELTFAYATDTGGPCVADIGGPAIINRMGTEYVAGLTSYVIPQTCDQYGVSTAVQFYDPYIQGVLVTLANPVRECENDVTCTLEEDCFTDFGGAGLCAVPCTLDEECAIGKQCTGGRCVFGCLGNSDCPVPLACWPDASDPSIGNCWQPCFTAADCAGEICNSFGLCGERTPPANAPPSDDDPPTCVGAQCPAAGSGGCAAFQPSLGWLLAGCLLAFRRRRSN